MSGQEMQVRWKHHQVGLLTYLRQMLTSEVFVDVTLCCQNKRLKAHRVLLSASSPYLQDLLLAHPVSDHTTIILDDIQYEDMKSLLDFVYTGGVTIPESRLESFLNAAHALHITVLTDKALHQQLLTDDLGMKSPVKSEEKTIPPLIKFDHEKSMLMHNFRASNDLSHLNANSNGFKLNNRYKITEPINEEKECVRKIGRNFNHDNIRNTNEFKILENDVKPFASDLWNNFELMRQTELTQEIKNKHIHDSFKIHPVLSPGQHGYIEKHNLSRSDFMDTSASQDVKDFPWSRRPVPSLRPISMIPTIQSCGPFVRKHTPPKRSLGGILTPSPWSQSGRPPAGPPRIARVDRTEPTDRSEGSPGKSPEHLPDVNSTGNTTNGSIPSSPKLKTLLSNYSEKESDQNSNSPSPGYLMENDENKPQCNSNAIKLCRLKERRLQDFYREQMMTNGVQQSNGRFEVEKNCDYNEVNDLSLKKATIPLFGDQESYVKFHANRLHHITRILGSDKSRTGEEVNPLHGLKTLANLLDDNTGPVGPPLQRRRSLSCSDLTEENMLRPNDTNNNEEEKSNGIEEDFEESKGNQTSLSCEDCGKVFGRRQLLIQHRRIHTGERPYVCSTCGKQFTQRGHWTAHQKLHEDSRQPEHSCSQCGKAFVTRASLKVHLRTHTGEKPFHCLECGKQFSQLRNYKYHRSVHEGTREFAATCPECGKYFNDRGYLSSHMKIHRNRKEYGCEYCGKSFNQRVAYNMHVRIHTGEKPHVCQHCNKSFSRKMLLKQHLRIHTGEKPFSCVVCQKAFADRSNMTLHMRLHSGVKPYTCSVCSKSFTKKHHLKTHMNYHTGVKPYVCSKCGLRFSQSSNMRTHYKKCSVATYQNMPTPPSSVSTIANSPLLHMTTTSGVTPPNTDESSSSSSIVKDTQNVQNEH